MSVITRGKCSHLSSELLEQVEGRVWCVRCDGYVFPDGSVQPRALVATPPVKRAGRFERAMNARIPFSKR